MAPALGGKRQGDQDERERWCLRLQRDRLAREERVCGQHRDRQEGGRVAGQQQDHPVSGQQPEHGQEKDCSPVWEESSTRQEMDRKDQEEEGRRLRAVHRREERFPGRHRIERLPVDALVVVDLASDEKREPDREGDHQQRG